MPNETDRSQAAPDASADDWSRQISELATLLMTGETVTLTPIQTQLLHEALRRSAADQLHIAKLQRRLERYTRSLEDLEMQADALINRLMARASEPEIEVGFSFEDARRIRDEAAQSIERADNGADVLAAVLTAAMRVLPLL